MVASIPGLPLHPGVVTLSDDERKVDTPGLGRHKMHPRLTLRIVIVGRPMEPRKHTKDCRADAPRWSSCHVWHHRTRAIERSPRINAQDQRGNQGEQEQRVGLQSRR